jgi:hypothetical protein
MSAMSEEKNGMSGLWQAAILAILCTVAYAPALNNGFIADDHVLLSHSQYLKNDFWFLFKYPPLNFRITSIGMYGVLKGLFGYRAEYFYAFGILLHFINVLLLKRFLGMVTHDARLAFAGAAMFAVFQAPQEAVMWITAMGETLQGLFILCTLLAWLRKRYVWSAVFFLFALFSKESALLVLAFVPLLQWQQGGKVFPRAYAVLLAPTAVFGLTYLYTWSNNHLIQNAMYVVRPMAAIVVVGQTLLQLTWPWLVVPVILFRFDRGRWPEAWPVAAALGAMTVTMLPYMFLTYSPYLPSRQIYLASMLLMWLITSLWRQWTNKTLRSAFVAVFVAVNIGYIWFQKDPQYVKRAAPTTQLLRLLQSRQPTQLLIFDFAYPYPDIAKDVSHLAPGWTRDLVGVDGTGETCTDCVKLRWNAATQTYDEIR